MQLKKRMKNAFDQYASEYDAWFMDNQNVLETELRLVASTLQNAGQILSIGCGSCLFEKLLSDRYQIHIAHGIEPADGMAAIARKRGFDVEINTAEAADFGFEQYDTVLFNGCPCYMSDLSLALRKAYAALRPGGRVVVIDVPKESPYGLIYNLALAVGTWDHPLLEGCCPKDPYPIELVRAAHWRTTEDKANVLRANGFINLEFSQTLTLDPHYSYTAVEDPMPGYDRGSYVAIVAYKPANQDFATRCWNAASGLMTRICAHPFLQEMAVGTLAPERFRTYLEQDCIYIANYGQEFLHLAEMLPEGRLKELFRQFAKEGIEAEEAMHAMLAAQFDTHEAAPLPGTTAYMNHTRQYFQPEDLPMAMAAMLPCMWVYNEVGKYILSIERGGTANPYHEWIACYASEVMNEGVQHTLELINQLAENESAARQDAMLEAFVKATEMEYIFWNQAY